MPSATAQKIKKTSPEMSKLHKSSVKITKIVDRMTAQVYTVYTVKDIYFFGGL